MTCESKDRCELLIRLDERVADLRGTVEDLRGLVDGLRAWRARVIGGALVLGALSGGALGWLGQWLAG